MALDPTIAARVAHLFDATLAQVLSGEVPGRPAAPTMDRADVERVEGEIPGAQGPVRVRIHRPAGVDPHEALPTLVWAHGGGWRYGSVDMPEADSVAQVVAATMSACVVAVDYRLAPEHTHPAGLDDVVAATRWALAEGGAHGIDVDRVALGGASAGGHLACLAALAMVEETPAPAALVLLYPVTDPVDGPWGPRDEACPPVIWTDRDATVGMFATYLGVDPDDLDACRHPDVVPAAADLSGLPPMLVTVAECDGLAPQGRRFVELARSAGVEVACHEVAGVLHGYANNVGEEAPADAALARHVGWMAERLGPRR